MIRGLWARLTRCGCRDQAYLVHVTRTLHVTKEVEPASTPWPDTHDAANHSTLDGLLACPLNHREFQRGPRG